MAHSVKVSQLTSNDWGKPSAFLNIDEQLDGHLMVWGCCYKQPTYLLQEGIRFYLICFDNELFEKEWMEENSNKFVKITKIEPVEDK